MKKLLAEWPQINWNLKLNQRHDTTRNRAQNKWSCPVPNWISWVAHMVENWVARIIFCCPNYFGLSKKKQLFFLVMNTKLHRNVLLVQMRLSIMLNSNIHVIVRRLLKTWNRPARGLLNLGEGRARGIRRQNESECNRYRETHWRYCSLTLIHRNEYVNSPAALVFDLSCVRSAVCSGWHQTFKGNIKSLQRYPFVWGIHRWLVDSAQTKT